MNKQINSLIGLLALMCLTGCQGPKPSAKVTSLGSQGYLVQGVFQADGSFIPKEGEPSFKKNYYITDVRGVDLNGIKKAALTIHNKTEKIMVLEYRFIWYDVNQMDVSADTDVWHPITLDARLSRSVSTVSKNTQATSFDVYVRELPSKKR